MAGVQSRRRAFNCFLSVWDRLEKDDNPEVVVSYTTADVLSGFSPWQIMMSPIRTA